jgi:hypothetical protein
VKFVAMKYIPIPHGAWMRLRQHGQTKWARNRSPIVWTKEPPPEGKTVYVIGWTSGQQELHATDIYIQE